MASGDLRAEGASISERPLPQPPGRRESVALRGENHDVELREHRVHVRGVVAAFDAGVLQLGGGGCQGHVLHLDGDGAGLLKRLAALPGTLLPYVAAFGERVQPLLHHEVRLWGELRPVFLDGVARGLVRALVELGSHAVAAGVRPTKTVTGTV